MEVISRTENYDWLNAKVLDLKETHSQESYIDDHLKLVEDMAKEDIPNKVIKEILKNEELLIAVASRSYEHVNHFDKIVLVNNLDPRGFRITLHNWNPNLDDETKREELIHDHRFSFWSHVMRGKLVSNNFYESSELRVESKDFRKYKYLPSETGNIHTCSFEEVKQLVSLGKMSVEEGDTYYLNYATTHRVDFPTRDEKLTTFVLRGPRERVFCNTYNTFYANRGNESSVPMMTPDVLEAKLKEIIESK